MIVQLLTEHHLEFLSLKESTLVKMPHCWKSHVMAHIKSPEHLFHDKFAISLSDPCIKDSILRKFRQRNNIQGLT